MKAAIAAMMVALCAATAAAGEFGNPKITQAPPQRLYHVRHYALTLHFDPTAGEVFGEERLELVPLIAGLRQLYLDSEDSRIDSVTLGRRRARRLEYRVLHLRLLRCLRYISEWVGWLLQVLEWVRQSCSLRST